MILDYEKFDEIDILISSGITQEEDKRISEYLKEYKAKLAREKKPRLTPPQPAKSLPRKRNISSCLKTSNTIRSTYSASRSAALG
jgi:hypothetical protein